MDFSATLTAVAISALETGHWSSDMFKYEHNWGGMINGPFATRTEGLEKYVSMLCNYYAGMSPREMQPRYCPPGKENWINDVEYLMEVYRERVSDEIETQEQYKVCQICKMARESGRNAR